MKITFKKNTLLKSTGFSLIELMIALVIAGILYAIAIPAYTNYLTIFARKIAETALMKTAAALEVYAIEHESYAKATLAKLHLPETIGQYHIIILQIEKTGYLLQAIPLQTQAIKDAACGVLQLDSAGKKSALGTKKESITNQCW